MLTSEERQSLSRTLAIVNGKGGSGKTSLTANIGGVLARSGYRTLLIDMDPQGDLGRELGYIDSDANDEGQGMFNAIAFQKPLNVIKGVRTNLDVVPAGNATEMITGALYGEMKSGGLDPLRLARAVAAIADNYDIILIDCPPREALLQLQALHTARWVVIPTQPEPKSIDGTRHVLDQVAACRKGYRPEVDLLAHVLFPVPRRASQMLALGRSDIAQVVHEVNEDEGTAFQEHTLESFIGYTQSVSSKNSRDGLLAIEASENLPDRKSPVHALAHDYRNVTRELLTVLGERESEDQ